MLAWIARFLVSCSRPAYRRGLAALQRAAALAGPVVRPSGRTRRRVRAPRRAAAVSRVRAVRARAPVARRGRAARRRRRRAAGPAVGRRVAGARAGAERAGDRGRDRPRRPPGPAGSCCARACSARSPAAASRCSSSRRSTRSSATARRWIVESRSARGEPTRSCSPAGWRRASCWRRSGRGCRSPPRRATAGRIRRTRADRATRCIWRRRRSRSAHTTARSGCRARSSSVPAASSLSERRLAAIASRRGERAAGLADPGRPEDWAGMRSLSPDGLPFIGPVPGLDGIHLATGHATLGITLAPLTGELIAPLAARGTAARVTGRVRPGARPCVQRLRATTGGLR